MSNTTATILNIIQNILCKNYTKTTIFTNKNRPVVYFTYAQKFTRANCTNII